MNKQNFLNVGFFPKIRTGLGITLLACTGFGIFVACGGGPPFPSADPPPTFAFHYVLSAASQILVPDFTGSTLSGAYTGVPVVSGYVPSGSTKSFGPTFVSFGSYYTVENGYWPGVWKFTSTGGCGAGTSDTVAVSQKVFELDCVPKLLDPTVSPTQYNSQSVAQLTLSFNPVIPAGTVATMRFLHATTGVLEVQSQMTFDGSSSIIVDGPNDIPDGGHYITFDFADNGYNPFGYDAMYVQVFTYGYNCTPSPNHQCL
jgi:hypothetical protein